MAPLSPARPHSPALPHSASFLARCSTARSANFPGSRRGTSIGSFLIRSTISSRRLRSAARTASDLRPEDSATAPNSALRSAASTRSSRYSRTLGASLNRGFTPSRSAAPSSRCTMPPVHPRDPQPGQRHIPLPVLLIATHRALSPVSPSRPAPGTPQRTRNASRSSLSVTTLSLKRTPLTIGRARRESGAPAGWTGGRGRRGRVSRPRSPRWAGRRGCRRPGRTRCPSRTWRRRR